MFGLSLAPKERSTLGMMSVLLNPLSVVVSMKPIVYTIREIHCWDDTLLVSTMFLLQCPECDSSKVTGIKSAVGHRPPNRQMKIYCE